MRQSTAIGGRYQLVKCLISGSATEVWLALDLSLDRDVVLKRLLADGPGSSRLRAEARALAAFNHRHVVTLHDTVDDPETGTFWLVMEHVPGGSLDGRTMSPERAAHVGAQIADALTAMHAEHIVHLDVKPANIVESDDGVVKLADFGAAYRVGGRDTITANGAISYTVAYAAPEVIRGQPDPRSDVFSLGATVYTLVAGRPPRRGAGDAEPDADIVAWKAAHSDAALTADVGPLDGLLREMLRLDLRERPAIGEVRRRLAELAGTPLPAPSLPRDRSPRRFPARTLLVAALAVAALLIAAGSVLKERDAPPPRSSAPSTPVRAADLTLGDHRSADPCAMTDAAALGRFGRTEVDLDYGNFDRCDVLVSPPGGGVVDVMADLNHDPPPEQAVAARNVGGIKVVDDPAESGECSRTLVLPGVHDVIVKIRTRWEDDGGKADLCEIADAAATVAAQALDHGPLKRRSPPLPETSLAQRYACALLSGKSLEAVPGIDATDPDVGFGGWDCEWDSTTSDTWVDLSYDRGRPPNAEDGTVTRMNGYRAFVRPDREDRTCELEVIFRAYADQNGQTAVEKVLLVVGGSRPVGRLCGMATALARSATAELRGV
ncbi:serine/threonine-protein kinase [Nonomuraea sp. NPDC050153]|uniref:serine/threonine-protein kinase n=1 Tax=Nonomuraea sp. NPDC050153 TaxID=3364359 RepID=UPI00379B2574